MASVVAVPCHGLDQLVIHHAPRLQRRVFPEGVINLEISILTSQYAEI